MKKAFSQKQKKYHSKTQLDEKKNLPFHDVFYDLAFLYFSTTRQVAFTLQKMIAVRGTSKQFNQGGSNPGPM